MVLPRLAMALRGGARWRAARDAMAHGGGTRRAAVHVAHTTACWGAAPMKNKKKPRPDGHPPSTPVYFLWANYGRSMGELWAG